MKDIYLMAHRANRISDFDRAITDGFNAIEFDVTKARRGGYFTWHGEWTTGWTDLDEYLDHLTLTLLNDESRRVSLLIVDLKYDTRGKLSPDDILYVINRIRTRVLDPVNLAEGAGPQNGLFALYSTYFTNDKHTALLQALPENGLTDHEGVNLDADYYEMKRDTDPNAPTHFATKAIRWRNQNGINNFMLSAGIAVGGEIWSNGWRNILMAILAVRQTNVFGSYAWTFHNARGAVNTMNRFQLEGVLGNANNRFGSIPNDLNGAGLTDHRLVTRFDMPAFRRPLVIPAPAPDNGIDAPPPIKKAPPA